MTTPMSLKPYDKFSSISNKTMVAIFPNVCLWRRSYAQNSEVLTLKNCHLHMPVRPTLLFRKTLGNLREFFGQIVYRPPWKKIARTPMHKASLISIYFILVTLGPFIRGKIRLSRINGTLRRDLAKTRLIKEQVLGAVLR